MKSVHDLTTDELEELRDIVSPDEIPMENVISHYEGTYFVEEDFFCNVMSILK